MHEILCVAEATLAAAGVASPRHDAHTLAAHLIGTDPLTVRLMSPTDLPTTFHHDYAELITRRAHREPLQHILGTAPFGPLTLAVGPGVFIPRPETEQLADWVATHLGDTPNPLIIDLCTGSGAIAGYLAHARPDADIYAVELSPEALTYTHTNLDPLGVTIVAGDATNPTLLEHLNGKATAVVTNPPYVPHTTDLQPEVYADPPMAVFGGDTGMDVITWLIPTARRLLAPGGVFACEHDDTTGPDVVKLVAEAGLHQVTQHKDWAGQPRFVTAICDSTD